MSEVVDLSKTPAFQFDRDTALKAEEPIGADKAVFWGVVTDDWNVGKIPNGGYLMATAGRALQLRLPHPDVLSMNGYYLRPALIGEARFEVEVLRRGRRTSTGTVRLFQDGQIRAHFTATLGDLAAIEGDTRGFEDTPFEMDAPDDCVPMMADVGFPISLNNSTDNRIPPKHLGFGVGIKGDIAEVAGWTRFRDGREPDVLSLLLFADVFPPPIFNRIGGIRWTPTLELTVQVRRRPAPGWLRTHFITHSMTGPLMEADGRLWDESGRLVAISRQLQRLMDRE